jgi:hypothetical protein
MMPARARERMEKRDLDMKKDLLHHRVEVRAHRAQHRGKVPAASIFLFRERQPWLAERTPKRALGEGDGTSRKGV